MSDKNAISDHSVDVEGELNKKNSSFLNPKSCFLHSSKKQKSFRISSSNKGSNQREKLSQCCSIESELFSCKSTLLPETKSKINSNRCPSQRNSRSSFKNLNIVNRGKEGKKFNISKIINSRDKGLNFEKNSLVHPKKSAKNLKIFSFKNFELQGEKKNNFTLMKKIPICFFSSKSILLKKVKFGSNLGVKRKSFSQKNEEIKSKNFLKSFNDYCDVKDQKDSEKIN